MKKFWLTTAITGIGCILAGLVLSVILVFGYADELKEYADKGDRELLHNLDAKYQNIMTKLDKIK